MDIKQGETLSQERDALHRGLVSLKVQQDEGLAKQRDLERREATLLAQQRKARESAEALSKREQALNQVRRVLSRAPPLCAGRPPLPLPKPC